MSKSELTALATDAIEAKKAIKSALFFVEYRILLFKQGENDLHHLKRTRATLKETLRNKSHAIALYDNARWDINRSRIAKAKPATKTSKSRGHKTATGYAGL